MGYALLAAASLSLSLAASGVLLSAKCASGQLPLDIYPAKVQEQVFGGGGYGKAGGGLL